MPAYTYQCDSCGAIVEIRHLMSETAEDCTECGSEGALVRVPSTFAFQSNSAGKKTSAKQRVDEFISNAKRELADHKKESQKEYRKGE